MAGGEIGYYTLPVIVSFKGIDSQVEDKLGKSIQDLGKKTGEQLGTAVITGLDPTKSTKVNTAIKSSTGPVKKMGDAITTEVAKNIEQTGAGKKMGEAVTTSITKNFDPKQLGKKIEEGLKKAEGVDYRAAGKKIGTEISGGIDTKGIGTALKDVLKEPLDQLKQGAKDWGKQVGTELKSGDIKGAATDVGNVVQNVTTGITGLGRVVGVNLDSVEKFGTDTATTIDKVGSNIQGVVDRVRDTVTDVQNVGTAVRAIGSGDVLSRIQGVSTALGAIQTATAHFGVDVSGITQPLQNVADTAGGIADIAATIRDLKGAGRVAGVAGELAPGAIAGTGVIAELGGLASAAGLAAPPLLAIGGAAAGAKWFFDLAKWNAQPGAPGTSPALAPEATIPTVPGFPGLPPLVPPARRTPPGTFEPAPPPPPPPPGRVAATEIPQPGWTRDPKTGYLYTPDGTPVPPVPGEYKPPPAFGPPSIAPPSMPTAAPTAKPAPVPGMAQAVAGVQQATINASTASVTAGSVTVSGGLTSSAGAPSLARPGFKSWFQSGGAIPIMAHAGEHMFTADDVAAMGGQAEVYSFRQALHRQGGGAIDNSPPPPPPPPRWLPPDLRRHLALPNRGAIKGVYYGGAIGSYDDGGEIKEVAAAIAPEVAKAAAQGAAAGAAGAKPAILGGGLGGAGGQDSLQFLSGMLGVAGEGAKEELGLGTLFPDPTANPSVRSLFALASAFKGPIEGAMRGKLGIQQPGWRPGMPVAAMAGDTGNVGSIGLPFGLPSIDIPAAPAPSSPEAPGGPTPGGPGGNTYNVDASINYHDGSVLGVDPAAQRAADVKTQERNLVTTVAPTDPGNH